MRVASRSRGVVGTPALGPRPGTRGVVQRQRLSTTDNSMRSLFLSPLLALGLAAGASAQVISWDMYKGPVYQQTANNTTPAGPSGWIVGVDLDLTNVGDATSVTLSGGGIASSIALQQEFEYWSLEMPFLSQGLMNATFPSGTTYTLTLSGGSLGTLVQSFTLGAEVYPNTPTLTGFDWSELQQMVFTAPFTIDWNTPSLANLLTLGIYESATGIDVVDTFLGSSTVSFPLPANALAGGTSYDGNLGFINSQTDPGTGFGAGGLTAHLALLEFPIQTLPAASVAWRNAGTNPDSYVATPAAIGSTWTATVAMTTGHTMATVLGMPFPDNFPLAPGGQIILIGGPKLFQLPLKAGPVASWSFPIPNDPTLVGQTIYTQGVHIFGAVPFLLTNAQDLTIGL